MGAQTLHEIMFRHGLQLVQFGVEVQPQSTE